MQTNAGAVFAESRATKSQTEFNFRWPEAATSDQELKTMVSSRPVNGLATFTSDEAQMLMRGRRRGFSRPAYAMSASRSIPAVFCENRPGRLRVEGGFRKIPPSFLASHRYDNL